MKVLLLLDVMAQVAAFFPNNLQAQKSNRLRKTLINPPLTILKKDERERERERARCLYMWGGGGQMTYFRKGDELQGGEREKPRQG